MDKHHYLLLLGTDTDDESWLQRARSQLAESGKLLRKSTLAHGPSVVKGDGHHYINQALLLETTQPREELAAWLKRTESDLGRRRDSDHYLIDIDLAAECDAQGRVIWQDQDKLAHALFRELAGQVLPEAAVLHGME